MTKVPFYFTNTKCVIQPILIQIASLEAELATFHEKQTHFEKREATAREQEEHLSSMQQEVAALKETIHQVH